MQTNSPYPIQLDLYCQRWNRRRSSYRPAGEPFDPSHASVQPIEESAAKEYVVSMHYSGTYPAARFRAGVFIKMPFQRERLAGVGVFSVPMNQRVIPAYFAGLAAEEGIELGRFVLDDSLPGNAESWCLARMQRLLREALPEVRGVLAYCDPVERRNEAGEVIKRGHIGTIYKATNAAYRGRSAGRVLWLAPSGECLPDRMLSKVRQGEQGEAYAMQRLAGLGAPRRALREKGAEYVQRLKRDWLRPLRHPGNLAFTWQLSE